LYDFVAERVNAVGPKLVGKNQKNVFLFHECLLPVLPVVAQRTTAAYYSSALSIITFFWVEVNSNSKNRRLRKISRGLLYIRLVPPGNQGAGELCIKFLFSPLSDYKYCREKQR
jgi:hypothetical protein